MLTSSANSPKAGGDINKGGAGEKTGTHCSDVEENPEDEDVDSEDEVLETSQSGRWQKINVRVSDIIAQGDNNIKCPLLTQLTRDVPGIDSAHLAMDTEEGVEVVWNEVCYSNRKLMKGSKV